jgi:hypothetical protein
LNPSLDRHAYVLDAAILNAKRQSRLAIKTAPRRIGHNLRERLLDSINHVPLWRGFNSRLNHGVTIATSRIISTTIIGHLRFDCSALFSFSRQGDAV